MKNFKHKGGMLTLVAPRNLLSGAGFQIGAIFAIAAVDALAGASVESKTRGIYVLPKATGQAWTTGARIYWDNTNLRCDTASASGLLIGVAASQYDAGLASGMVCLSGCVTSSSAANVPGAPTVGIATAGDGAITVQFTNPASDGGSALTGFTGVTSGGVTGTAAPGATSMTFYGVANGVDTTVTIKAVNAIGASAASAVSNSVLPTAYTDGAILRANAPAANGIVESGDTTVGYTYTGTTATGFADCGVSNRVLPATDDGGVVAKVSTYPSRAMVGLKANNTPATYTAWKYGLYFDPTSNNYKPVVDGAPIVATTARVQASNDDMRVMAIGTTINFQVSSDNRATWTTIHSITGVTRIDLYPCFCTSVQAGPITNFRADRKVGYYTPQTVHVIAGNSLAASQGASTGLLGVLDVKTRSAIANHLSVVAKAVGGQTFRNMSGLDGGTTTSNTDVDALYDSTKAMLLEVWEITNSVWNARTAAQTEQDATDWATARKAANPKAKLVAITALPRYQETGGVISAGGTVASANATINAVNAYFLANYRAMGFDAIIDVRQTGSPFNVADYSYATLDAIRINGLSPWTTSDGANAHVHLSDVGYSYVNDLRNQVLAKLPA